VSAAGPGIDAHDEAVVHAQLGRAPRSIHAVAHRCPCGNPEDTSTEPPPAEQIRAPKPAHRSGQR
jgi:hypothetical protein